MLFSEMISVYCGNHTRQKLYGERSRIS